MVGDHRSIMNWVDAAAATLPQPPWKKRTGSIWSPRWISFRNHSPNGEWSSSGAEISVRNARHSQLAETAMTNLGDMESEITNQWVLLNMQKAILSHD
jgi:hypothetical protein